MGNQYSMAVRCSHKVQVEQRGKDFFTLEKCPNNVPPDTEIHELMDNYCPFCPKIKKENSKQINSSKESKKSNKKIFKVKEGFLICEMDAVELVKTLPDESVDLIIIDPAYESLEKYRRIGTTTRLKNSKKSNNKWFKTFPNKRYWHLFPELFRVLKKGSYLFMFCDQETRDIVVHGAYPKGPTIKKDQYVFGPLVESGFTVWKSLIWNKGVRGMGYHFRAIHEFIIFAEKIEKYGKHRQLVDRTQADILDFPKYNKRDGYPTQKPYDLIEHLVLQGSYKGDLVLDCFAGSGVVGDACLKNDRKCVLGDIQISQIIDHFLPNYKEND